MNPNQLALTLAMHRQAKPKYFLPPEEVLFYSLNLSFLVLIALSVHVGGTTQPGLSIDNVLAALSWGILGTAIVVLAAHCACVAILGRSMIRESTYMDYGWMNLYMYLVCGVALSFLVSTLYGWVEIQLLSLTVALAGLLAVKRSRTRVTELVQKFEAELQKRL